MKRVVIDTNVLISSIFSSHGAPARIMDMVSDKEIQLLYNAEILEEYIRVLAYERLKIDTLVQQGVIQKIVELGVMADSVESDISMPDESDRCFYDLAKTNSATLITYNDKHYPVEPFIVSPADLVTSESSEQTK